MKPAFTIFIMLLTIVQLQAQESLPIIDMHIHAASAAENGPPLVAICVPFNEWLLWDQLKPYGAAFMEIVKNPTCDNPVWGPETDQEVMKQTIEARETHNVVLEVLSGSLERTQDWRKAAPARFLRLSEEEIARHHEN